MGLISRSMSRGGRLSRERHAAKAAAVKAGANRYKKPLVSVSLRPLPRLPRLPQLPGLASWSLAGLAAGIIFIALSVSLLYGYRFFTRTAYFALKSIEIEGAFRVTSREVLEIAGIRPGDNSLGVSIDGVEARLTGSPWIEKAAVRRALPSSLFITVKEREPYFWIRRDDGPSGTAASESDGHEGQLYYADIYGKVIAPVTVPSAHDARPMALFPLLEVERGAGALTALLPGLLRALSAERMPLDMADISRIRLSYGRGVEIVFERNSLVISLGHEALQANLARLRMTLADLVRRGELGGVREVRAHGPNIWVVRDGPAA